MYILYYYVINNLKQVKIIINFNYLHQKRSGPKNINLNYKINVLVTSLCKTVIICSCSY